MIKPSRLILQRAYRKGPYQLKRCKMTFQRDDYVYPNVYDLNIDLNTNVLSRQYSLKSRQNTKMLVELIGLLTVLWPKL